MARRPPIAAPQRTTPSPPPKPAAMQTSATQPLALPDLDLTARMRQLCEHICATLDELKHIDMRRVALRVCQTRRRGPYGVQATMTPLRFRDGATSTMRRNRRWVIRPLPLDAEGKPCLYLFSLYAPRFLELPATEKLAVTIHELWHISPMFDGDLRRFPGRYHAHGSRCDKYHDEMRDMTRRWQAAQPATPLVDFLDGDFQGLRRRYGRIYGMRLPTPRLWRVDALPLDERPADDAEAA
jgi:hypothetical protein